MDAMKRYLDSFLEVRKQAAAGDPERMPTLDELKNDYIEYLLDRTFRNKSLTARILNISRTALYDRLALGQPDPIEDASWLTKTRRLSSH
jgi:DNA-binding NtrC family response regulator